MKKLLLSTLLVLSFLTGKSQAWIYHPFPADSAVWVQNHVSWDGTPSYSRTYFIGDTVIGAFTYNKVYYTSTEYYTPGGYYPAPVPAGNPYYCFREDIAAKKAYYFDVFTGNEKMLYDFNLGIGDIAFIDSMMMPHDTIKVIDIDSVNVGGFLRKRFVLDNMNTGSPMEAGNWIEGVGSESGLIERFNYGFEFSNQLVCFSVQNVAQYPFGTPSGNCGFALGIKELLNGKIEVSIGPNPAKDEVSLWISCKDTYSIELINAVGEIVLSKKELKLSGTSVDLAAFVSGVYFFRISDSKGNSATKKIVKQ